MRNLIVFAFVAAVSAMIAAPASASPGAIEVASPLSSPTTLAFNPQPDPPGLTDEDFHFDRG